MKPYRFCYNMWVGIFDWIGIIFVKFNSIFYNWRYYLFTWIQGIPQLFCSNNSYFKSTTYFVMLAHAENKLVYDFYVIFISWIYINCCHYWRLRGIPLTKYLFITFFYCFFKKTVICFLLRQWKFHLKIERCLLSLFLAIQILVNWPFIFLNEHIIKRNTEGSKIYFFERFLWEGLFINVSYEVKRRICFFGENVLWH